MNIDKIPIWLTDWTFQHPKNKSTIIVTRVICKGWDSDEIMNNPMLISRALKQSSVKRNKLILKPIKVVLKSQHGFGPPYTKEESLINYKHEKK